MRRVAAILVLAVGSCAGAKLIRLYDGAPRPDAAVAQLLPLVPTQLCSGCTFAYAEIPDCDGRPTEKAQSIHLLPGRHSCGVVCYQMRPAVERVTDRFVVDIVVDAGRTYIPATWVRGLGRERQCNVRVIDRERYLADTARTWQFR